MKTRLLVIDDEPQITAIFERLFTRFGYEIRAVNDPRDAVIAALEFGPDIIFSDIAMPPYEGRELAAQLQSALPRPIPLVFLTAQIAPCSVDTGRRYLGDYPVLSKPLNLQQILTCIRELTPAATQPVG